MSISFLYKSPTDEITFYLNVVQIGVYAIVNIITILIYSLYVILSKQDTTPDQDHGLVIESPYYRRAYPPLGRRDDRRDDPPISQILPVDPIELSEASDTSSSSNDIDEKCILCASSVGKKSRKVVITGCCQREIHESCYSKWGKINNKCPFPYCETKVT